MSTLDNVTLNIVGLWYIVTVNEYFRQCYIEYCRPVVYSNSK